MVKKTNRRRRKEGSETGKIYVVTVMDIDESIKDCMREPFSVKSQRVVGWFQDLTDAHKGVSFNSCNIRECLFNYAVIEGTHEGMYCCGGYDEYWYRYNEKTGRFKKCKKPKSLSCICGFGIG